MKGLVLRAALLLAAVAGFVTLFNLVAVPKAQAASCGVNTGTESSYAGLIVDMYWWPYTGGTLNATGVAMNVNMTDNRGDADPYGNIIYANATPNHNGWKSPITSSNNETFNEDSSACSDGHNVVLGYFQGSSTTGSSTNPNHVGPWFLDCDASQFGVGNERIFTITGVGVPSGARAGGSWEVKSFRAVNGRTVVMSLAYSEPPPPGTIGNFEGVNCSTVGGWAFDPNNSGASIQVHAYYGGPAGSGAPGIAHTANLYRSDVNAAYGIGGNHGFSFANDYPNATTATNVYIYAISTTGGGNSLIGVRAYGPCTHAATLTPITTATPSGWINPSDNETLLDQLQISNYGGIDHIVKLSEYRSYDGGATYTLIRNDGVLAANSNRTQNIWSWTPTAAEKANNSICERMIITDAGGATTTATSSTACINIRHGKTSASVVATPNYIQQAQSSTLTGYLVTSGFVADSYPINCTYNLVKTTPAGAQSSLSSGSCSRTITANSGLPGQQVYSYNYVSGADPAGTSVCLTVSLAAGDYTGSPATDTKCTAVVAAPYFRALGGDVVAGAGYLASDGSCTTDGTAVIKSWNNNAAPYFGAATELAAMAMNDISSFAAATLADNGAPTTGAGGNPSDLSFANTGSPLGHIGGLTCMPDYYTLATQDSAAQAAPGTSIASWGTGIYTANGPYYLKPNTVLPANAGTNVTLAINGDVYIDGNVKYPSAGSDVTRLPRFTVIAKGNIYIGNGVDELHGAYIAQANGTAGSGTIYTCAVISQSPLSADVSNNYANCGHPHPQLTIYGAVAAQNLNLGRSQGSLHDKVQAETFVYTPELWIGGGTNTSLNSAGYDSVTSLPPTL